MAIHIGLVRAINLAGHNKVTMADLRRLLADLGLHDAQSLLQSGNLVFRSDVGTPAQLERTLEAGAEASLGLRTEFFVRTANEWKAVVAANPFPDEARRDPQHLLVMLLKEPAAPAAVRALQDAIAGREMVRANGRQAYIVYPDGIGRSRLTTALIEKKLGTRCTGRNWNTVIKLGELAKAS